MVRMGQMNTRSHLSETHDSIKRLVPEYKTGNDEFDRICVIDYHYGIMGIDWKNKYNKNNYHIAWYNVRPENWERIK